MVFGFLTDGLFHKRLGAAKADEPSQFQKLMTEFQGFFDADEEAGPDVLADFATIMNKGLRRKPNDEAIKTAMAKYKFPANIPNMKVPATNPDVTKALKKGASILDFNIRKAQQSLAKGMVPLVQWLHDFGSGKVFSIW